MNNEESVICRRKLNQLNELMDYLKFSIEQDREFYSTICFFFLDDENNGNTLCVRVINMKEQYPIITNIPPTNDIIDDSESFIFVKLSIKDFLYLYSGKATTSEIAHLCFSGKIKLKWTAFQPLRSFANSFNFTPENWKRYYEINNKIPENDIIYDNVCNIKEKSNCICLENLNIDINENDNSKVQKEWQIVFDSIVCAMDGDDEWEIIEDEKLIDLDELLEDEHLRERRLAKLKLKSNKNIMNRKKEENKFNEELFDIAITSGEKLVSNIKKGVEGIWKFKEKITEKLLDDQGEINHHITT